ncbi:hypothetical protein P280DRAFT_507031 [Massarina eburnea CBS 473.64]|uniref:Rhodopsin domain-containing protein n=1 Tax=Massarina eburnea CBS 473.64 TaxID=1395130 RepID=A0A6A6S447_9PLEO|nr:hypothetical protein P280DRAFT_507031 [Massarina eburnea CBS 473.64]
MATTLLLQPTLFSTALVVVNIVFPVLSTSAVILRFYARKGAGRYMFFADDWLIVATLVFCWANTVNTLVGAGQIGVETAKVDPGTQAKVTARTLWTEGFLLATALALAKIAVLYFYYRIFATKCANTFKFSVWSMYAILIGWWISSVVCQLLVADPINGAYDPTIPFNYRYDYSTWSVCFAAMSLAFDVIILLFPVPVIGKLRMDFRRKISVIGIFWLGAFCCVAAAVRLYFLYIGIYKVTSSTSENPYENVTAGFIWAHVEPNCSIIAACLPTYGTLFHSGRSLSSLFGSVRSIFSISGRSGTNSTGLASIVLEVQRV